jgi:hypothetical protein
MSQHQHPLFTDPLWTDAWHEGDRVNASRTTNRGVIRAVKPGRYLLIRWDLPTIHTCRHHSPRGLVKA